MGDQGLNIRFSKHGEDQMKRRNISKILVFNVLKHPDRVIRDESEIWIYQKKVNENGVIYLYRVFINPLKEPTLVITTYKTSKVNKYED